jgi:hypothetical protein
MKDESSVDDDACPHPAAPDTATTARLAPANANRRRDARVTRREYQSAYVRGNALRGDGSVPGRAVSGTSSRRCHV